MQSSSGGGGGVISALCRVWGPKGVAPTQRPIDASSRHWFWKVWGEYLENIEVVVVVGEYAMTARAPMELIIVRELINYFFLFLFC